MSVYICIMSMYTYMSVYNNESNVFKRFIPAK